KFKTKPVISKTTKELPLGNRRISIISKNNNRAHTQFLNRTTLISRELCKSWNWVQPKGKLKEYAARDLLLRLEEQGLVALPPRIRPKNNLKPRVLSIALRRLSHGWESVYGHPVYLAETFVDATRFQVACYQAANWMRVGKTLGECKTGQYVSVSWTAERTLPVFSPEKFPEVSCS
ncbi:MAG: DUF4338 domain-containing protein, partial [Candidatus Brocadia sp.]